MKRRELRRAGPVAGAVAALRPPLRSRQGLTQWTHEACIKACQECSRSCNETFHHCYEQVAQGRKEHARALHLVADCAKFCNLSSDLVANGSPLMAYACAACAEACKMCAAECGKFEASEMKDCAKQCSACEKTCLAMVRAMGGQK